MDTETKGMEQYPLRVQPWMMEGLRKLAKRQRRSLNKMLTEVLADYMRRQNRRSRRMDRWVIDGTEYNTETAEAIASYGKDRYGEESSILFKGSSSYDDEYWMAMRDEDTGGWELKRLNANDAYTVYLGMPLHLVDEEEAFGPAEVGAES